MKPNPLDDPSFFHRPPKPSSVPLQPYVVPVSYYPMENLSPHSYTPPMYSSFQQPDALYAQHHYALNNPMEKHPYVLQRSTSGPSYVGNIPQMHYYDKDPEDLQSVNQIQVPISHQINHDLRHHFTPKTAHQKVMRQKQVFAEFHQKSKKQSTSGSQEDGAFKFVESDGSLKSAKMARVIKASSFKNYTRVSHKSSPMNKKSQMTRTPPNEKTPELEELQAPKSPKSGWINPKTQYHKAKHYKELRFRSRSSSQPQQRFSISSKRGSGSPVESERRDESTLRLRKPEYKASLYKKQTETGQLEYSKHFDFEKERELPNGLETPGFPNRGKYKRAEDSAREDVRKPRSPEMRVSVSEVESQFSSIIEQQSQEIKELKIVVSMLAQENQYLQVRGSQQQKKQKIQEMLHNAQRTTTSEIKRYKSENEELREEVSRLKEKILKIYDLLKESETDPSYHLVEVRGIVMKQELSERRGRRQKWEQEMQELANVKMCMQCLKEIPKPFNFPDQRSESCSFLLERNKRRPQEEQKPLNLKDLVSLKLLQMVRKKQKKKNPNESPDPFNPIVSPAKTKQTMSYNNILPKRQYLLESPEEDQKTTE